MIFRCWNSLVHILLLSLHMTLFCILKRLWTLSRREIFFYLFKIFKRRGQSLLISWHIIFLFQFNFICFIYFFIVLFLIISFSFIYILNFENVVHILAVFCFWSALLFPFGFKHRLIMLLLIHGVIIFPCRWLIIIFH